MQVLLVNVTADRTKLVRHSVLLTILTAWKTNALLSCDRDTMQQERIAIDNLVDYINKKLEF